MQDLILGEGRRLAGISGKASCLDPVRNQEFVGWGIMKPIRIVLADDHNLVRSGLKSLLLGMPGVEVVAEATNGKEAVALASIAGYLGIAAGVGVLATLDRVLSSLEGAPFTRPEVDFRAAVIATVILIISGAAAGIFPARHAARISPVEALRAE